MNVNKCEILKNAKTIAIVGLSRNEYRVSRDIANYLSGNGYKVAGINPNNGFNDADGIIVYNNLMEIPYHIDIINVFRRSEDIPALIDDVISVKPDVLWLQLGIRNDEAAEKVLDYGIKVVQDSCIKIDHRYCF